jgi:hypothetical protein
MTDENPWEIERRLWLDGPIAYAAHVDPECVMVFPAPVGVLTGPAIAESLTGAPRWAEVEMEDAHLARPADDLAVLAYRADARRAGGDAGGEPYRAWCTSTYRRVHGTWALLQHQQTPD